MYISDGKSVMNVSCILVIENKLYINDMVYFILEKGKVVFWNKLYISDISCLCVIWDIFYICNKIGWEIKFLLIIWMYILICYVYFILLLVIFIVL